MSNNLVVLAFSLGHLCILKLDHTCNEPCLSANGGLMLIADNCAGAWQDGWGTGVQL